MRLRTKLAILCAGVVALVFVVALLITRTGPSEPYYKGRSLSDWNQKRGQFSGDDNKDAKLKAEASDAIRQIGTNALPLLLNRIRYEQPPVGKMMEFVYNLPFIGDTLFERAMHPAILANEATGIFLVLGEKAAPALPELQQLMNTATDEEVRARAVWCLMTIGDKALPVLVAVLGNPEHPASRYVATCFGISGQWHFGTNLIQAVPPLIQCSTAEPELARYAVKALGTIHLQPQLTIPALRNALAGTNERVRVEAVKALCKFDDTQSLELALSDPSESVRILATNELGRIATNTPSAKTD